MPQKDDGQQAQAFHSLVRLLESLGSSTEGLFARLYTVLSARDKAVVDAHALQAYQERAEAIRDRARRQTIEIARLTGILGQIDEGVIMQAPDGRIILMNEAAQGLIGSTKNLWQTELGQLFRAAHGVAPVQRQMQMVGEPQEIVINNRVLGARLAAINSDEGEHLGTVMIIRNISHQVEAQLGDRLRDSFIGQLSHELRTPLTSIKGMSDVLLNLPEGKPPKRSFLEAINRNVATLDRMVVELLDLSEIAAGSFDVRREPLRLDDIAFTVLKGYEDEIERAGLRATGMIANTEALTIHGDNRRLQWAVGHLLDNAIKYTPPGGDIIIQLGHQRRERVLLQVADSGVGIAPEHLPRIFERFYRATPKDAHGQDIDPRGLGQGLYIAEAVVEAHEGYLSVISEPGVGTVFTAEFPLAS